MKQITKTRKEKKEETHRKLVDAALKHFELDGIIGTRTIDIAKTAGVSHGTVFLHFPTRDELLISVMQDFGTRVTRQMRVDIDSDMGIKTVLSTHLNVLSEFEELYSKIISELPTLPDDVQIMVISINSAISHYLNNAVSKEVSNGTIKKIPMSFLFNTWISLIHYYLQNKKLFCPNGSLLQKRRNELVDNFMSLISERKFENE